MSVILNEPGLQELFTNPLGPVGIALALRADEVRDKAAENASGSILGVRSHDLLSGLTAQLESGGPFGLEAVIGTNAIHRGFAYPAFHDQNGRPWLTRALQEVFS